MSGLLLALVLGFKHGLDADHLSLIDNLGRWLRDRAPRAARFAGLLFSSGHSLAVMAMTLVATEFGQRFKSGIPGWLEGAGTVLAAVSLVVIAGFNLKSVFGPAPAPFTRERFSRHLDSRSAALAVMALGALFALSFDTLTQAALFASLGHHQAHPLTHAASLSAVFGLGMVLSDTLNGLFVNKLLDRLSQGHADHADALAARGKAMRFMTLSLASLSLVVAALAIAKLFGVQALQALEGHELHLGLGVLTWVMLSYLCAAWLSARNTRHPARAASPGSTRAGY